MDNSGNSGNSPVLNRKSINPEWKDAMEKAMHSSLMGKGSAPPPEEESRPSTPLPQNTPLPPSSPSSSSGMSTPPGSRTPVPTSRGGRIFQAIPAFPSFTNTTSSNRAAMSPVSSGSSSSSLSSSSSRSSRRRRERPRPPPPPPKSTYRPSSESRRQADKEERMELLSRLQTYIREKGFQPFRPMGPDDPIEDLRYEVFRAQREQNKKRNVKYMQRALITVAAGLEMLHKKWNPLDLKLEGYSKSILLTIHDFDEIFEELHWKYCDAVAMPVEIKLVLTLASSVWFYHLSAANNISSSSSTGRASGFASSEMPPPTTDEEPSQPRMSGPKMGGGGGGFASGSVSGGFASGVGSAPDMSGLLSGLGMVQTLLQI